MSNYFPSFESFAKGTAATAAGLSTVGMGLLYYGQNFLIYPSAFPPGSRVEVPTPADFSLPYADVTLVTPDNVNIKTYILTQRRDLEQQVPGATPIDVTEDLNDDQKFAASRPTVIMFHGNGGNHGHRIPLAKIFYSKMRCNVVMPSYRGYGRSEGSPSEKGLQIDAQTVLDHVLQHETLGKSPIILYGQSIGGAVAIDLASKNAHAITAMVLENTFMSLPRLIPTALPLLGPFSFLCHQKWESYLKVPKIPKSIRILLLGGARDEVVPREQMQGLWELIRTRSLNPSAAFPSASSSVSFSSPGTPMKGASAADKPSPRKSTSDGSGGPAAEEPVGGSKVDGGDKYIEYPDGTHNDTCVQHGYWKAVSEFIASLDPSIDEKRRGL